MSTDEWVAWTIVLLFCLAGAFQIGREVEEDRVEHLRARAHAQMDEARAEARRAGKLLSRAERLVGDVPDTVYAASCRDGSPPPWVERARGQ